MLAAEMIAGMVGVLAAEEGIDVAGDKMNVAVSDSQYLAREGMHKHHTPEIDR